MTPEEKQMQQRQLDEQLDAKRKELQREKTNVVEQVYTYHVQKTHIYDQLQSITTPGNWNQGAFIRLMQEGDDVMRKAEREAQGRLEEELTQANRRHYHQKLDDLNEAYHASNQSDDNKV